MLYIRRESLKNLLIITRPLLNVAGNFPRFCAGEVKVNILCVGECLRALSEHCEANCIVLLLLNTNISRANESVTVDATFS